MIKHLTTNVISFVNDARTMFQVMKWLNINIDEQTVRRFSSIEAFKPLADMKLFRKIMYIQFSYYDRNMCLEYAIEHDLSWIVWFLTQSHHDSAWCAYVSGRSNNREFVDLFVKPHILDIALAGAVEGNHYEMVDYIFSLGCKNIGLAQHVCKSTEMLNFINSFVSLEEKLQEE